MRKGDIASLLNILVERKQLMKEEKKTSMDIDGKVTKYGVIFFLVLIFTGITCVPFIFQTTTLWYKFGPDRIMLYVGQLFGLYAAFLLLLQFVLVAKLSILTNQFGQGNLNKLHQFNGKLIIVLALFHVLLILLPEGLTNIPIGVKFWPEMVGGLLLIILLSLRLSVWVRTRMKIKYATWKSLHGFLGVLAFLAVVTHVVNVSDAFDNKTLFIPFLVFSALAVSLFLLGKYLQKK